MGTFSVALSAWALTSVTSQVLGSPEPPEDSFVESRVHRAGDDGVTLSTKTRVVAGFRMEGAPELDIVFGDTERYRHHVDRFFSLDESMRKSREEFSRGVQTALATLAEKRGCPEVELAPSYRAAHTAAEAFRRDGAHFEAEYVAIHSLDELGETSGLTPDYRWKVGRVARLYHAALVDLREMRVAFVDQLGAELAARGCAAGKLLALAPGPVAGPQPEQKKKEASDSAAPLRAPAGRKKNGPAPPVVVPATTITFFIDNRTCTAPQRIYLDGMLLGVAAAHSRTAFQALAGRHSLCLLDSDESVDCGASGTVRSVYMHDGWSIELHCQQ
jgi:hypothetical protein